MYNFFTGFIYNKKSIRMDHYEKKSLFYFIVQRMLGFSAVPVRPPYPDRICVSVRSGPVPDGRGDHRYLYCCQFAVGRMHRLFHPGFPYSIQHLFRLSLCPDLAALFQTDHRDGFLPGWRISDFRRDPVYSGESDRMFHRERAGWREKEQNNSLNQTNPVL